MLNHLLSLSGQVKLAKLKADPNYRDRVEVWLHDGAGNLLVGDQRDLGFGFKLPAGGIEPGQSVDDAALMEMLEEVGYRAEGKPMRLPGVGPIRVPWDDVFKAEAAAKGRNFEGSRHFHRLVRAGEKDDSLLGSQGDAIGATWLPAKEILEGTLAASEDKSNKYNYFDKERLRGIQQVVKMMEAGEI